MYDYIIIAHAHCIEQPLQSSSSLGQRSLRGRHVQSRQSNTMPLILKTLTIPIPESRHDNTYTHHHPIKVPIRQSTTDHHHMRQLGRYRNFALTHQGKCERLWIFGTFLLDRNEGGLGCGKRVVAPSARIGCSSKVNQMHVVSKAYEIYLSSTPANP